MHEVGQLRSLAIFVGTGRCNANCRHCAGRMHRRYAPKKDGEINEALVERTLRESYIRGARYLSISSSGEPTLSPNSLRKTLEIVDALRKEGVDYNQVNLYSNGIKLGEEKFCEQNLGNWRRLGLKRFYITVHDVDEERNAQVYRVKFYPSIKGIIERLHSYDLGMRANIVLSKNTIHALEGFVRNVERLIDVGADSISAWVVRDKNDEIDKQLSPSKEEIARMESWSEKYGLKVRVYNEEQRKVYEKGEKLTLFPDGTLSNKWCK